MGSCCSIKFRYREENLEALKAMVSLRLYQDTMPFLDMDRFSQSQYKNNWDDSLSILYKRISGPAIVPTTQAYITHCCPEEKWEKAKSLFEEIRQAMRARIEASTWLSEESKGKCLEKIDDLILQPIVPPAAALTANRCWQHCRAAKACRTLQASACGSTISA